MQLSAKYGRLPPPFVSRTDPLHSFCAENSRQCSRACRPDDVTEDSIRAMAELAALIVGTARGIGARGGRNVDGFSSSLSVVHTNGKRPIGPLLYPCRPTETPRQCQMVAYVRDPLAVHADLYFELSVEWREILNSSCTLVHGFMDGLPLAWDVSHQNHQPHHHLKYSAHYAE